MFNSKSAKLIIALSVIVIAGILVFSYLYSHGLTDIRTNPAYKNGQIKVACVGDSVTYGYNLSRKSSYPALLSSMMGEEYHVCNFGISGSTVQDSGDQPYTATKAYKESLDYEADILVFMLGSNDSKPENWKGEEEFRASYNKLLDTYLQKDKIPDVYLCTPPTAYFPDGITEGLSNYDIQPLLIEAVADIVRDIAKERDLPIIEINNLTENHRELFGKDNVHPNNNGAKAISEAVYEAIR